MKIVSALLLIVCFPFCAYAQQHKCFLPDGTAYEAKYPCDPVTVEKFAERFFDLLPEEDQQKNTVESLKVLYLMAIETCDEPFLSMTPEEVGKNGEPFFTWQFTAAMTQAAREIICPEKKGPKK